MRSNILNRQAILGMILLSVIVLGAIFCPFFSSYAYDEINLDIKNSMPSFMHIFGTDELGRDIFVRCWWGARISILIGFSAAIIDIIIGVVWGVLSGFIGGKIDTIMIRICDILQGIPNLLMIIMLLVIMGPGIVTIICALTITGWISMARIVRGQVLHIKNQDYVLASKIFGASNFHIITKHIIPNAASSIIATMTLTIPSAIFIEAFLSFLGLGVQAPVASWGVMINDSITAIQYYPWRVLFPSFMIIITMISFHLIGEGLNDSIDPKYQKII